LYQQCFLEIYNMKKIVFKNLDGSCGIIIPAPDWAGTLEELAAKDVPAGLTWRIVDATVIPTDRTFREAWTDDNPTTTIDVDMTKARSVHMAKIREERNKRLDQLDKKQLQGLDVATEKQTLRDLPQTLDLTVAKSPTELKALWPKEL